MVRLTGKSKLPHLLSLRLPDDVFESLRQAAEEEDRAISHMVRVLVRESLIARGYMDSEKKKKK